MKDKTLLVTLLISIALVGVSGLVYPYYAKRSTFQEATWHLINSNIGGLQGEANLLTVGDQVVMVDTGQRKAAEEMVLKYLLRLSVSKVHHLFISETNRTHFAGLATIIQAGIPIERIYYLKGAEKSFSKQRRRKRFERYLRYARESGAEIIPVEPGFTLDLPGNASLEVLKVIPNSSDRDNMAFQVSTMLLRFNIADSRVLFSGDIGREYANYLIEKADSDSTVKQALTADYFKLPQPDTLDPTPSAFYDLVDARFAFVPSPKRRWCTDEGAVAREWSFDSELPTWVTGPNGHIRVTWKPGEAMILPQFISGKCKLKEFGSLMVRD
ncbi:MAG: hypothetical protein KTR18_06865 [Acidiferrobacterales bacterium]|nr:hypothetical protein [Acidiferrobacterales bacterium]